MSTFYSRRTHNVTNGDAIQHDPYWLILIVPFANPFSYNQDIFSPGSVQDALENPVKERTSVIIDNDCVSWTQTGTKSNHVNTLSLSLAATAINYVYKMNADDWIFFWAFDNYRDFNRIKKLISNPNAEFANDANSGLKFVGRIDGIFEDERAQGDGRKFKTYSITAKEFSEFDSLMYFDPLVQKLKSDAALYWADFTSAESKFIKQPAGIIATQDAVAALLFVCMGLGPGEGAVGENSVMSPNKSYLIPETVARLLIGSNQKPIKGSNFSYIDILKSFIGVHEYSNDSFVPTFSEIKNNFYFSPKKIEDPHLLQPTYFNNEPVWSILESYLNRPINEMYTCLRLDENNRIVPTFMCRRIPFTNVSDFLPPAQTLGDDVLRMQNIFQEVTQLLPTPTETQKFGVTKFLSLPRWEIPSETVMAKSLGRSSALRRNYMHIIPNRPGLDERIVRSALQPIADTADIQRNGLRPEMRTIGGTIHGGTYEEFSFNVNMYNKFLADVLFDGHMKLNGSISTLGIQAPICVGDNCSIDGIIYHIESISHSGSISSDGRKNFSTNLSLSYGISTKSDEMGRFVYYDKSEVKSSFMGINYDRG